MWVVQILTFKVLKLLLLYTVLITLSSILIQALTLSRLKPLPHQVREVVFLFTTEISLCNRVLCVCDQPLLIEVILLVS